ncbi:hypothetical protein OF83DRAFT_767727 [Amylostereum chailletii]|nr:hypothetical protein OF83DRAFT_767727 [Amylostereum chailletii]
MGNGRMSAGVGHGQPVRGTSLYDTQSRVRLGPFVSFRNVGSVGCSRQSTVLQYRGAVQSDEHLRHRTQTNVGCPIPRTRRFDFSVDCYRTLHSLLFGTSARCIRLQCALLVLHRSPCMARRPPVFECSNMRTVRTSQTCVLAQHTRQRTDLTLITSLRSSIVIPAIGKVRREELAVTYRFEKRRSVNRHTCTISRHLQAPSRTACPADKRFPHGEDRHRHDSSSTTKPKERIVVHSHTTWMQRWRNSCG